MVERERFIDSLKQQRLPAHQGPSLSPTCLLTFVFLLGIFCIGIGQMFTYAAKDITEVRRYYHNETINETVNLTIELTGFEGNDVFVYYQLEGFSQLSLKRNERGTSRYAYDFQHFAKGNYSFICTGETPQHREVRAKMNKVAPNSFRNDTVWNWLRSIYLPDSREEQPDVAVPCGVRASLFFTDNFQLIDSNGQIVPFSDEDITWKPKELPFRIPFVDETSTAFFKNPVDYTASNSCAKFRDEKGVTYPKPTRWKEHICKMKGAMENEDFIVWMTPSYGYTFRKPWRKLSGNSSYQLENGNYTIEMENNWMPYPDNNTKEFENKTWPPFNFRKAIVFTTVNWAGGKNNFLGIAYTTVGVIILFIGCGLALLQSFYPSYLHEESEEIRWRKNA